MKYYQPTFYIDASKALQKSSKKTVCSKNFLTLQENAYADVSITNNKDMSTVVNKANYKSDFKIEITKGT